MTPEGSGGGAGVNRDVAPQLHNLTELMQPFVMGRSAPCHPRPREPALVCAPSSRCLLGAEQNDHIRAAGWWL